MVDSFGGFMQLPIRRRGNFTKDDFFKDFQTDFDSAIQSVMDRHSGRSLLADQFSVYRKMRENANDAGPAASVSETQDSTVIVLDMSDFVKGSMSVKTRGQYVVVEANYEQRSFNRKFLLPPSTNFDGLKTAMSNEGILTITAPKKGVRSPETPRQTDPILKLHIIDPDTVEGRSGSSEEASSQEKPSSEPSTPSAQGDRKLSISQKGNFFQDAYFENVWKDFEKAMDEMVQKEEEKRAQKKEQRQQEKKELVDKLKNEMFMDAERKQKDFFEKAFEKENLSEFGIPKLNRLNSYRNLRSWAPESETQAYTITKDGSGYKIIMDVKNFSAEDGDISVKATEGSLTVTGKKGPLTFQKEFSLNGLTNPDQVQASVSEDGVLTITVSV